MSGTWLKSLLVHFQKIRQTDYISFYLWNRRKYRKYILQMEILEEFRFLINVKKLCMPFWMPVCVHEYSTFRSKKWASDPLKLELLEIVNFPMWCQKLNCPIQKPWILWTQESSIHPSFNVFVAHLFSYHTES